MNSPTTPPLTPLPLTRQAQTWSEALPNPLTQALERQTALGHRVLDLTSGNAPGQGLAPTEPLLKLALADSRRALSNYQPDALGQGKARQAVAHWYARRGVDVDPEHVLLTPGTSQAYLYLFRCLLEPGDEVLVPWPGYPLFDDLAALAQIKVRFYYLRPPRPGGQPGSQGAGAGSQEGPGAEEDRVSAAWSLDFDDLAFQCTPRTRALVLVTPHNPLGCVASADDYARLANLCEQNRLTLVVDEVFSEFLASPVKPMVRPRFEDFGRVCLLNGFSKMLSLPGMKLGWIALGGQPTATHELVRALEHISDTLLPVSELAQSAAEVLLDQGDAHSAWLAAEYLNRRRVLQQALQHDLVPAAGGVYACLPLPRGIDDEAFCLRLLEQHQVLVHPGYLYNLADHLVMTCVAPPEVLAEGGHRLTRALTSQSGVAG